MNEVVDWIWARAIPLASVPRDRLFGSGAAGGIIGDARIVSLGEATHGTREFFQLKHRMLEFCVAETRLHGVRDRGELPGVARAQRLCAARHAAIPPMRSRMRFWTWDTEEVLALIEWMRAWNGTHDRKVKFYGFDMQFPAVATLELIDYLRRGGARPCGRLRGAARSARRRLQLERFGRLRRRPGGRAMRRSRGLAAFARDRPPGYRDERTRHGSSRACTPSSGAKRAQACDVPSSGPRRLDGRERRSRSRSKARPPGPCCGRTSTRRAGVRATSDDNRRIPNWAAGFIRCSDESTLIVGFRSTRRIPGIAEWRGLVTTAFRPLPGSFEPHGGCHARYAGLPARPRDRAGAWAGRRLARREADDAPIGAVYSAERAETHAWRRSTP